MVLGSLLDGVVRVVDRVELLCCYMKEERRGGASGHGLRWFGVGFGRVGCVFGVLMARLLRSLFCVSESIRARSCEYSCCRDEAWVMESSSPLLLSFASGSFFLPRFPAPFLPSVSCAQYASFPPLSSPKT